MPSLYRDSQSGSYYAQFYDSTKRPKNKRISLRTSVKREARSKYNTLVDAVESDKVEIVRSFSPDLVEWLYPYGLIGNSEAPTREDANNSVELGDAADGYINYKRTYVRESTLEKYEVVTNLFSDHVGKETHTNEITEHHVASFLNSSVNRQTLREPTKRSYRDNLSIFFTWCMDRGYMTTNPAKKIKLPKKQQKKPEYMMPDDVAKLVQTIYNGPEYHHWLAPIVSVNVHLGLRRGELINMQWGWINWNRRMLTVKNTSDFKTKTGEERTIPISESAYRILKDLHKNDSGSGRDSYVFQYVSGKVGRKGVAGKINEDHITHLFAYYRKEAGLPNEISLHSLRHTACSWLAMGGAHIETIRQFAGHTNIKVTEKYTHIAPSFYKDQVLSCFDRIV